MQNVAQKSAAAESVGGNCVKQHEVGVHRVATASSASVSSFTTTTSSTAGSSSKPSKSVGNSLNAKSRTQEVNQQHPHSGQKQTVTVTDLASSNLSSNTEAAVQQIKQGRSYQYMPESSDSDSDDILSVSHLDFWPISTSEQCHLKFKTQPSEHVIFKSSFNSVSNISLNSFKPIPSHSFKFFI